MENFVDLIGKLDHAHVLHRLFEVTRLSRVLKTPLAYALVELAMTLSG